MSEFDDPTVPESREHADLPTISDSTAAVASSETPSRGRTLAWLLVVVMIAVGLYQLASNNDDPGSPTYYNPVLDAPLVGSEVCSEMRSDLYDGVDDAVIDAQSEVDRMIAENPELAPYAYDAKETLRESAPDARDTLDDALAANGC